MVSREGLWKIMEKFGCPSSSSSSRSSGSSMTAWWWRYWMMETSQKPSQWQTALSKCVLAPSLISMVFSPMLTDAFRDCQDGLHNRFRADGGLFNLRRLKAVTKVKETVVRELLIADNCALSASTEQKKHYKDCIKASLQDLNINISNWEQLGTNRTAWHSKIFTGVRAAEKWRTAEVQQKRVAHKARAAAPSTTAPAHICPMCGRAFQARIGLSSHLRTHSHRPSTWPVVMVIVDPDGRTTTSNLLLPLVEVCFCTWKSDTAPEILMRPWEMWCGPRKSDAAPGNLMLLLEISCPRKSDCAPRNWF